METLPEATVAELTSILTALTPQNDIQLEIVEALREATMLPKTEAINLLRLRLDASVLINNDVNHKRSFYRAIFSVLSAYNHAAQPQPGILIISTVIDSLYNTEELKTIREQAHSLHSIWVHNRAGGHPPPRRPPSSSQDVRMGSNTSDNATPGLPQGTSKDPISRRISSSSILLKNSEKFTGEFDSGVSIRRLKQQFDSAISRYEIPRDHQVELLKDALDGLALDLYYEKIQNITRDIKDAFQILEERFDSRATRAQAQSYLDSLTLNSIRQSEYCTTAQALATAKRKMISVSPMCGPEYQGDAHKARWLALILRNEDWAQPCLTARMTQAYDYGQFVASLNAAITQHSIIRAAQTSNMLDNGPKMAIQIGTGYSTLTRRIEEDLNTKIQDLITEDTTTEIETLNRYEN